MLLLLLFSFFIYTKPDPCSSVTGCSEGTTNRGLLYRRQSRVLWILKSNQMKDFYTIMTGKNWKKTQTHTAPIHREQGAHTEAAL